MVVKLLSRSKTGQLVYCRRVHTCVLYYSTPFDPAFDWTARTFSHQLQLHWCTLPPAIGGFAVPFGTTLAYHERLTPQVWKDTVQHAYLCADQQLQHLLAWPASHRCFPHSAPWPRVTRLQAEYNHTTCTCMVCTPARHTNRWPCLSGTLIQLRRYHALMLPPGKSSCSSATSNKFLLAHPPGVRTSETQNRPLMQALKSSGRGHAASHHDTPASDSVECSHSPA
jgi:hypothetical protein